MQEKKKKWKQVSKIAYKQIANSVQLCWHHTTNVQICANIRSPQLIAQNCKEYGWLL